MASQERFICPTLAPPIILTEADWEQFLEALDKPPAPNEALKALFAEDGPRGDNKPFTVAG